MPAVRSCTATLAWPRDSRHSTTSACPFFAARCSGVRPSESAEREDRNECNACQVVPWKNLPLFNQSGIGISIARLTKTIGMLLLREERQEGLLVPVGGRQVSGGGAARGLPPHASLLPLLLLLPELLQIAA